MRQIWFRLCFSVSQEGEPDEEEICNRGSLFLILSSFCFSNVFNEDPIWSCVQWIGRGKKRSLVVATHLQPLSRPHNTVFSCSYSLVPIPPPLISSLLPLRSSNFASILFYLLSLSFCPPPPSKNDRRLSSTSASRFLLIAPRGSGVEGAQTENWMQSKSQGERWKDAGIDALK